MSLKTSIISGSMIAGVAIAVLTAVGGLSVPAMIIKLILISIISAGAGYFFVNAVRGRVSTLLEYVETSRSGNGRYKPCLKDREEIGKIAVEVDGIIKELNEKTLRLLELEDDLRHKEASIRDLKAAESYFRGIFEQSNDAVFIYCVNGRMIDVNRSASLMMGYTKEELLKMAFIDLHTEEELAKTREARFVGADARSLRFESEFRRSNGKVINVEISSSVVDMKRGTMQAVVVDITARKELEEALKRSEEKFRTFMETASDLMYIADGDGKLSYVNKTMFDFLGYTKEEIYGINIIDVMDKGTKEAYLGNRSGLARKGELTYEAVWKAKNTRQAYGEMKETAIYDSNGIFSGSRGVFRDISERKKIERAQRLSQIGELAANVAHEMNNLVMVISGRTELALMDDTIPKVKDDLEIILDQCKSAEEIVKRLLKFSKPSKGDFREHDVNEVVGVTLRLVENQFTGDSIAIIRKFGDALPRVTMDEKLMQEVLINLLRNAAEAMPNGGSVTVSTFKEGDKMRIDLTDTGSGISEEDMKRIFDPFFTTKENGTGLGLSACYGIVKTHNGELKYSSEVGKGTTATILLPLFGK